MNKLLDLNSFDTVGDNNKGEKFELVFKGSATGVFLTVLGKHADVVKLHQTELNKEYARKAKFAEKKGTEADLLVSILDKSDEQSIKNACVRVIAWEGLKEEFNLENLNKLFSKNPQWVDEVVNFSDDLGK